MNKPKKERAAQMAQTPFLTDEFKIKIYPPTFKDVQTAYAYFTRNRDQFKSDFADDKDEDYLNTESIYKDSQDFLDEMIDNSPPSSSTFANKVTKRGIEEDDKRGTSEEDDNIPKEVTETLKEE